MAHILVVDDAETIRQVIMMTLRGLGYDIAQASDGQAALALAQKTSCALVLADVNMPRMDGIALVRALRALPSYKFTPIVMITTESSNDKKQAACAAGATGWIVKPFRPEQLLTVVKKVLG